MTVRFEALKSSHDRAGFHSGVEALDGWFHQRASQDQRRRVSQVFVALDDQGIVGFYSLSMFTLTLEHLPAELSRKLPRYDAIPAALIGRLARHQRVRGTGIGELLIADAVRRVVAATASVAAYAVVVDAKDDRGQRFYEAPGFIPLPSRPHRLFLPIETIMRAIEQSSR